MSTHTTHLNAASAAYLAPRAADAPVALKVPGVGQRLRYAAAYWSGTLASLLGTHRLHPDRARRYSTTVQVDERLRDRWHRLFKVPTTASVPLTYHQGASTLLCTLLLGDLGVNLRHLLHLRHRTVHGVDAATYAAATTLRLACGLKRALRIGDDKVLLEVETLVLGVDGRRLATVEDGFIVRELPALDLFALPRDRGLMRELLSLRRRASELDAGARSVCHRPLPLAPGLGADYGRVCGDMNPVHTAALGCWLFGIDKPFLQGLGLRNLVVRELAGLGVDLDRLQITFARPAHLGQTLSLVVAGERFEVLDAYRRLIAYGSTGGAA